MPPSTRTQLGPKLRRSLCISLQNLQVTVASLRILDSTSTKLYRGLFLIHVPSFLAHIAQTILFILFFNVSIFYCSFFNFSRFISFRIFPSVNAGDMAALRGGRPSSRAISLILLLVAFFAGVSLASVGDQLEDFKRCLDVCPHYAQLARSLC